MSETTNLQDLGDATVYGSDGDKIGAVGQVYLDNESDQPEWVTVKTGMFGTKETFVPLAGAQMQGSEVHVRYDKATVKDAPKMDADGELSPAEEQELYRHYGLRDGAGGADSGTRTQQDQSGRGERSGREQSETAGREHAEGHGKQDREPAEGHDTSGRNTDDAMTRSEEQLRVGTQSAETGRARLRKYVVTEQQTQTVPVSHEEVRIEREPITEDNRGASADGPGISEEEHEVVLHAEKPMVEKETVAVERVKLGTETVRDEETVTGEVRKEQIETDGDVEPGAQR